MARGADTLWKVVQALPAEQLVIRLVWLQGRISPHSQAGESERLNPHGASGDPSKVAARDARSRSLWRWGLLGPQA